MSPWKNLLLVLLGVVGIFGLLAGVGAVTVLSINVLFGVEIPLNLKTVSASVWLSVLVWGSGGARLRYKA